MFFCVVLFLSDMKKLRYCDSKRSPLFFYYKVSKNLISYKLETIVFIYVPGLSIINAYP